MQKEVTVALEQVPMVISGSDGSIQISVQEQIETIRRADKENGHGSCPNQVHGWDS